MKNKHNDHDIGNHIFSILSENNCPKNLALDRDTNINNKMNSDKDN